MELKRESLRYAVDHRRDCILYVISFKTLAWRELSGQLVDISKHGVGLEVEGRIEPGFVWFRDRLGGYRSGVVMWIRPDAERSRAGIRFAPLTRSEEQFLEGQIALIRDRSAQHDPGVIIPVIMEAFTRISGTPAKPDPLLALDPSSDQELPPDEDIIGQLRSMISEL